MTDWRDDRDDAVLDDALVSAETPSAMPTPMCRLPRRRWHPERDPDEERDAVRNGDRDPTWRCP